MLQSIHPAEHPIFGLAGVIAGGRISKFLDIEPSTLGTECSIRLLISDSGEANKLYKKPFVVNARIPVGWKDFKTLREVLRNLMRDWPE